MSKSQYERYVIEGRIQERKKLIRTLEAYFRLIFGTEDQEILLTPRIKALKTYLIHFGLIGEQLKKQKPEKYLILCQQLTFQSQDIEHTIQTYKYNFENSDTPPAEIEKYMTQLYEIFAYFYLFSAGIFLTKDATIPFDNVFFTSPVLGKQGGSQESSSSKPKFFSAKEETLQREEEIEEEDDL